MAQCVAALKEWTGKTSVSILYDSVVDEFTDQALFDKVKGRPDIAIVGFTTEGDVFGGYYHVSVGEQDKKVIDPDMFIFTFECHGRCDTPKRFLLKASKSEVGKVRFFKDDSDQWFVDFGLLNFFQIGFGNEKSTTFCFEPSIAFEGIEDTTLTGGESEEGYLKPHSCVRLLALHIQ